MRLWIGLALIAFCARTNLADYDEYMGLDKQFRDEQDYLLSAKNIHDNVDLEKKLDDDNENEEKNNEDIENFYKSLENVDDKSIESDLNDYQIEDNRSEPKDEQNFVPLDNQNDIADASDENENWRYIKNFFADFNDSPVLEDSNQSDDDDIFNMDESSNIEPLQIKDQNILTSNVPDAEENDKNNSVDEEMDKQISHENNQDLINTLNDENKPLDAVDDILNKVFDDAENAERIQKTFESIEKTNELVNNLEGEFLDSTNVEDEQEQKVQKEASYEDVVQMYVDSDEMQQSFNEDLDDEEINESNEEQPADDDKLDTIDDFQELKKPVSQQDAHNYDTNSDTESKNDDGENGKQSDDFEQIINKAQALKYDKINTEETYDENDSDEDTIDKMNDLDDDYQNLFKTWKDLQDDTVKKNYNNLELYDKKSNEIDEEQPADVDHLDTRVTPENVIEPLDQEDYQHYDINHEEKIVEGNIDSNSESSENENGEHSNLSEQIVNENQVLEDGQISAEDTYAQNNSDEDTVDKINNSDELENLSETWEKQQEDGTKKDDNILDYEEKYNKPYREGNILSIRAYDEDIEGVSEEGDEKENISEIKQKNKYFEDADISSDLAPILGGKKSSEVLVLNDPAFYLNITVDERKEKDEMEITTAMHEINDKYENTEKYAFRIGTDNGYDDNGNSSKTVEVDDLTPEQYEDMMKQFAVVHSEDLDTKFGDKVAPIHMVITAAEPVVIESPDYPNNYPTNNVVDYFFDGLGTGIEFNISEFSVNGILGDYLLVKPGGIDVSGSSGLVFSYHLNNKRQYRFTDVDRLFVRFSAHPGPALFKGYQFSVKMISPPDEDEELQPEPEPLLPPPASLTVTLGGSSLEDFTAIQEDFRLLIADMATMYINANSIAAGLNTTSETAQITGTSLCNINWPGYESCVAVTFGVPLAHGDDEPARLNEEDLRAMWDTYVQLDPFASRLRRMGITEFAAPNDRRVLTVWLVIAAGVLISVAMLAIALWRFSCFEDYTRMAAYSDTDSVNEKRVLDMYPTPHQTFPALYGEQQLTWDDDKFDDTTRVDMGGYANKNYVRDEMVDLDSDEDVITTPRDRNSFSPRDVCQV